MTIVGVKLNWENNDEANLLLLNDIVGKIRTVSTAGIVGINDAEREHTPFKLLDLILSDITPIRC